MVIWQILTQINHEAPRYGVDPQALTERLAYGVGTRLITSWGEPALGGVYKLVAIHDGGQWQPAIKVSESPRKTPNPGVKKVWRLYDERGKATADLVALAEEDPASQTELRLHHPHDVARQRRLALDSISRLEPLLETVYDKGKRILGEEGLETLRERRRQDVALLDPGVRRLVNPHRYHVSLSHELWSLKQRLIAETTDGDVVL
jgi:nicotinate phosphoribosyltransferase